MKVTDEMVAAYGKAWEAKRQEIGRGIAEPGTKTRAGLEAALAAMQPEHEEWCHWGQGCCGCSCDAVPFGTIDPSTLGSEE